MIVLWGISADGPLNRVREELARRNAPFFFLDQRRMLATELELELERSDRGELRVGAQQLDLSSVKAVYLRPYAWQDSPELAPFAPDGAEWRYASALYATISCWLELSTARLANPLSAASLGGSKPQQLRRLQQLGFRTPATLVTTDPVAVREFLERHKNVIYKSTSSVRSIVSQLTEERMADISDVAFCPAQFQEHIPGEDYRVHVFGDRVVATKVVSDATDYRYAARANASVKMSATELPGDLTAKCVEVTRELGLVMSGIDLRRTPDGAWYCFEVNSSPGFTYYEENSGQPLAAATADLLVE